MGRFVAGGDKSIRNRVCIQVVNGPMLNMDGSITENANIPILRSFNAVKEVKGYSGKYLENITTYEGDTISSNLYKALSDEVFMYMPYTSYQVLGPNNFIGRRATKSYNCHRIFKGSDITYDSAQGIDTSGYNYYGLYNIPLHDSLQNEIKSLETNLAHYVSESKGYGYYNTVYSINLILKDNKRGRFPINRFNVRAITSFNNEGNLISETPGDYTTNKKVRYFTVGDEGYWLIQYCDACRKRPRTSTGTYTIWNPAIEIDETMKDDDWQITSWECRLIYCDWSWT